MPAPTTQPDPSRIHEALGAFRVTMALKGAVDLELFTHIAAGAHTTTQLAAACHATEKGIRVLCDFLTMHGFLQRSNGAYDLDPETGIFLDKNSPAYMGSVTGFLVHETMLANFSDVAALVRKGGAVHHSTVAPDDPLWVEFARSMAPMISVPAKLVAVHVTKTPGQPAKVLDIAAGHGLFGIFVAQQNPAAQITAVDWDNVLQVARENAQKFGVADRFHTIPGSAFDVDLGAGYDLVLVPNFLHHFDQPACIQLLKKLRAAMNPGALLATVEFVPNEDRISPPYAAGFAMMMLGNTDAGDAYTFTEYDQMFRSAGFGASEIFPLRPAPQQLILTRV
ncbi:MAG: class I SAM-dependent methyltransferase [Acidobacteriota bacterium]